MIEKNKQSRRFENLISHITMIFDVKLKHDLLVTGVTCIRNIIGQTRSYLNETLLFENFRAIGETKIFSFKEVFIHFYLYNIK